MINLLLVFCGGGVGSLCRYLGGVGFVRAFGSKHGYLATMGINVLGGLLMGVLIGVLTWLGTRGFTNGERVRLLLGVGVLGGFTTFSTFSLESVLLFERKAYAEAAGYVIGSVSFSLIGVFVGLMLMRKALA
ncbi:MAG: CrcB family protein [Caulobacteraceae bacterium]